MLPPKGEGGYNVSLTRLKNDCNIAAEMTL